MMGDATKRFTVLEQYGTNLVLDRDNGYGIVADCSLDATATVLAVAMNLSVLFAPESFPGSRRYVAETNGDVKDHETTPMIVAGGKDPVTLAASYEWALRVAQALNTYEALAMLGLVTSL